MSGFVDSARDPCSEARKEPPANAAVDFKRERRVMGEERCCIMMGRGGSGRQVTVIGEESLLWLR
jgi:hypothetical protein